MYTEFTCTRAWRKSKKTSKTPLTPMRIVRGVAHSPNLSVTSPTSQLILQPFRRFTYVTTHSPTLPLVHLRHSSFSNPSFASPTSQALHLIHLASRPYIRPYTKHVRTLHNYIVVLISLYQGCSSAGRTGCRPGTFFVGLTKNRCEFFTFF